MLIVRSMCDRIAARLRPVAVLVIVVVTFATSVGLASVGSTSGKGAFGPLVQLSGEIPPVLQEPGVMLTASPAGAASRPLTLTITLKRREQAAFETYLNAVQDPTSSLYRHFLTPGDLTAVFGPSQSEYDSVLSWLLSQGFTSERGYADRLTITAHGTLAQVERAFHVDIADYSIGGRTYFGPRSDPQLPASIAKYVQSVSGLTNVTAPIVPASPISQETRQKCLVFESLGGINPLLIIPVLVILAALAEVAVPIIAIVGATTNVFKVGSGLVCLAAILGDSGGRQALGQALGQAFYAAGTTLISANSKHGLKPGDRGTPRAATRSAKLVAADPPAQKIGLLEFDTYHPSDVTDWLALAQGNPTIANRLSEVNVNGGVSSPGAGESEVLLDIDTVLQLAPAAPTQYVVYDAPPTTSFEAMFDAMISDGDTVISNSWSSCEDQVSLAEAQAIDSVLAQAAATGISVLNGAGDHGSTCLDGSPNTVGVPADAPHATAVGGTSAKPLVGGLYGGETWWDGTNATPPTGQGGFGVSKYFTRPSYQNPLTSSSMRSVPDLSVYADPADGIEICQADAGGCPTGLTYGGTSMAAPEAAADIADVNIARGSNIGELNPTLYPLANTAAFNSPASMGSDFAHVGLGSPNLTNLLQALQGLSVGPVDSSVSQAVSSVAGPADGSTPGFVDAFLASANGVPVSGQSVSISSSSSTTVITPVISTSQTGTGAVSFDVTDTVPEEVTFTVTDMTDGTTLSTQPTITFTPPQATGASIQASTSSVPDDGTTAATVTVYLENGLGQPASGKTVTLSENGSATIYPSGSTTPSDTAVTGSNGDAVFTATDTNAENVQFTAVDSTDGNLPVPGSASVTFYSGSPPTCTSPPVAAAGYSMSKFASGFAFDPYDQILPGNFNVNGCDGLDGMAFDPNGNLYVSDFYTGTINVLPPGGGTLSAANQLPDTALGPDDITSMAFGKDGELYATLWLPPPSGINNNEDPEVVQLDPSTGAIVRTVAQGSPLPYCPGHLAVDPLTGDLFVSGGCTGYLKTQEIARISNPSSAQPTVSIYADTSSIGTDGIPYGLAFAPNGTLYAVVSGVDVVAIGGTNTPQPATITPVVQTPNYGELVAITGTSNATATSLVTTDLSGNTYSIDLTKSPPVVSSPIVTGDTLTDGIEVGPDSCVYVADPSNVYRLGAGNGCGSSGNVSTTPSITLSSTSSLAAPPAGSPVSFTANLDNVPSPAGTPILFTVSGANSQVKLVDASTSGSATFTYSALHPGTDTVTATTTSGTATLTSNPIRFTWGAGMDTSSVTLNGSQEIGPVGQAATFTASLDDISQSPSTPVNGAMIGVMVGTQGCTITTNASGTGTCQITPSTSGLLPVTALYGGSSTLTASGATDSFFAGGPSTAAPPTAPAFTNTASDTVPAGAAFSYSVTTSGTPTPAISLASGSTVPSGVTLTDNGNGTATLAGTSSVAAGSYIFTLQAANGVTPNATQVFALTVTQAGGQISLKFRGLFVNYTNSGSLTSGSFSVTPSSGTITSVTGTGTIPGLKGGSATITVKIQRYTFAGLSAYLGTISVSDPGAHVNTIAVVLAPSLTRVGTSEASGNAEGLLYLLNWTL
ncbi:MAG: protease pro-enzyme activation domain-containing protein [Acidimicrobiales bacterium]|nr:protease pro-enzyme activation domain-containing protein [Acidimicrobiales bacterium]